FALFGSLRKTLTANSQLNIKDVRFTEQGEDIYL
ncbi:MAG: sporulation/spore germination protein, partial [Moorea sp. SIO3E2]|nr:sporulation/spore germination protein [Moorena sp. SIO3E2]